MPVKGRKLPADIARRMEAANERARVHDAQGWRDELRRWHDTFDRLGLGAPSLCSRMEPIAMAGRARAVVRHGAVARLIGPDASRRTLPRSLLPAIVLTLDAPDEVIRAAFEAELRKARAQDPFPVMKQGRKSKIINKPWSEVFASWKAHDILSLAEFLTWRSRLGSPGRVDYPDVTFARWRDKDKETTSRAKTSLFRAIASLPKLSREVATAPLDLNEDDQPRPADWTPYSEADWIAHFEGEAKARDVDS